MRNTSGKGQVGTADVTVSRDKVRVAFDEGQIVDILREDAPDYIISGRQNVTLSSDNTHIQSARPAGGSYICKFSHFASREDTPPEPKVVPARSGISKAGKRYSIDEHLEFTAVYQIIRGKFKGYQLIQNLFYAFSEYGDGITQISGNGSRKLEEFLLSNGLNFTSDDIPFSDNVLPYLEKLIISKNKYLIVQISPEGWITTLADAPEEYEEEQQEEQPAQIKVNSAAKEQKSEEPSDTSATFIKSLKTMALAGDKSALTLLKNASHTDWQDVVTALGSEA